MSMKKLLITGAGSYIGSSFAKYLAETNAPCVADTLDMTNETWRSVDFRGYDCVLHVAGITHQKESKENALLYDRVNRDLAEETARRAKEAGVSQFIFMSSMSVYGLDVGKIGPDTPPAPTTRYGRSKLEAEEALDKLRDDTFRVCVLRPPMVYGKGCKGNFQKVVKLVRRFPVFPDTGNRRSMIHVDNLCSFLLLAVERGLSGLYFPQDRTYMNTADMAVWVGEALGKKTRPSRLLGLAVRLLMPFSRTVRKAFGTLVYSDLEAFGFEYCESEAEDAVKRSV